MKCVHPRVVYDGQFRSEYPCGKCVVCRRARTREWANRCMHELAYWEESCFLTLTYDDKHLPENKSLDKTHFKSFMKMLRMDLSPKLIKYFGCGEYGGKFQRPHYHLIIFGLSPSDKIFKFVTKVAGRDKYEINAWKKGFIDIGSVSYASCAYVAGYIQSKLGVSKYPGRIPPFQVQSQGLGKRYALENATDLCKDLGFRMNGMDCTLPRYYKKVLGHRIFDYQLNSLKEAQLEKLDEFYERTKRFDVDEKFEYQEKLRVQDEKTVIALRAIRKEREF